MKKTTLEMQWAEKKRAWTWATLMSAALALILLWAPAEWHEKTVSDRFEGAKVTEVTQPWTRVDEEKKTISLWDLIRDDGLSFGEETQEDWPRIEPDPEPEIGDWWKVEWWGSKESRIWVHWFVQVWTSVVPDFAGIFSDKVSGMIAIDAKDQKTWLWLTAIRLDDFHTDPEYPLSKASVVVPYRTISSKDGKRSGWASVEFSFIDQMPETVWVTPVIVWSFSADGWTIEWKYFHDFKEWKDMDAFRLWITKKISDALRLTAQWWYKSDYKDLFYGRVIADVDLWRWFWAQLSCIMRDWKFTPTMWVMYKF
jgi:hypothetical protein